MSNSRHLLLLSSAHALILSCAGRPEPARSALVRSDAPVALEARVVEPPAGAPPVAALPVANSYAPVRTLDATVYSWQSERRVECTPEPVAGAPEAMRALDPSSARGVLAALPERTFDSSARAQPINPDAVVAGLRPALHHCFSHWLDDQADAQGSVRLALELGCAGEVEAISAENAGVDSSTLACLFSAVGPARFAAPAGGHAVVHVPVVFKNAAR